MIGKPQNLEQLTLNLEYAFEQRVNFRERTILLLGEVGEEMFELVETALTQLESHNRQPITFRICSDGGDVVSAQAIVGRMRCSKCKIITEGFGTVESAAVLILAAGHKRKISKYCTVMHHEEIAGVEGRLTQLKAEVLQYEAQEQNWAQWMADFSKKSKKFYYEEGKNTDKYWTPDQMLEFGIVDEII